MPASSCRSAAATTTTTTTDPATGRRALRCENSPPPVPAHHRDEPAPFAPPLPPARSCWVGWTNAAAADKANNARRLAVLLLRGDHSSSPHTPSQLTRHPLHAEPSRHPRCRPGRHHSKIAQEKERAAALWHPAQRLLQRAATAPTCARESSRAHDGLSAHDYYMWCC